MNKKLKAPARNVLINKKPSKTILEMDSDEVLEAFEHSVAGGEKRPARNATVNKDFIKPIVEMDSDEILDAFGHSIAGGETKRKLKMKVSGKSVFGLKEIIVKKAKKSAF